VNAGHSVKTSTTGVPLRVPIPKLVRLSASARRPTRNTGPSPGPVIKENIDFESWLSPGIEYFSGSDCRNCRHGVRTLWASEENSPASQESSVARGQRSEADSTAKTSSTIARFDGPGYAQDLTSGTLAATHCN
jgi:hypothetical protein